MKRIRPVFIAGGVLLAVMAIASLGFGSYPVAPGKTVRILAALVSPRAMPGDPEWTVVEQIVVQSIRLPRVLLAMIAGAGLGLAGASLQGLFRNPLVSPDTIGVASGAACGGVLAILLGLSGGWLAATAFGGGMLAVGAATLIARAARGSTLSFVLAGVIVAAFFSAALSLMQFLVDPITGLSQIMHWLMGGFAGASPGDVALAGLPLLFAGGALIGLRWRINLLSLGDDDAIALGLQPTRLRVIVIALAALIVASQVAASGVVGWVGLIVPHLARMMVGPDHRRLLPASALLGAIFMLGVDDLARSMTTYELPTGVLTAFIGTPSFAWLLYRSRLKGWERE